jgi:hypothetical protein
VYPHCQGLEHSDLPLVWMVLMAVWAVCEDAMSMDVLQVLNRRAALDWRYVR